MPRLWTGLEVSPHKTAEDCKICSGSRGGPFLELACGHGSPMNQPMHAHCLAINASETLRRLQTVGECPTGDGMTYTREDLETMRHFITNSEDYPYKPSQDSEQATLKLDEREVRELGLRLNQAIEKSGAAEAGGRAAEGAAVPNWGTSGRHLSPDELRTAIDAFDQKTREIEQSMTESLGVGDFPNRNWEEEMSSLLREKFQAQLHMSYIRALDNNSPGWTDEQLSEYNKKLVGIVVRTDNMRSIFQQNHDPQIANEGGPNAGIGNGQAERDREAGEEAERDAEREQEAEREAEMEREERFTHRR